MEEDSPYMGVRVVGPDARIIYKRDEETNDRYELTASSSGVYTYCFTNNVGSMDPKLLMFEMRIGDSPAHIAEEQAKMGNGTDQKLFDMVNSLGHDLWSAKSEQEYMEVKTFFLPHAFLENLTLFIHTEKNRFRYYFFLVSVNAFCKRHNSGYL